MTQKLSNLSFITKPPRMTKNDSFTDYCDKFKTYVRMTGLTENLDLLFLQNVQDKETYPTLKTAAPSLTRQQKQNVDLLCKHFLSAMYGEQSVTLKNNMLNMKQKSGETVTAFCNRIQEAGSLAYTETEAADEACLLTLLRGLTSRNIRQKLNEATIATFSEAKRLAKRMESVAQMFEQEPTSILKTRSETEDRPRASFETSERSTSRGRSPTPHWRTNDRRSSRDSYRSNSRGKHRSNRSNSRSRDRSHSRSRDRSHGRYSRSNSRNSNYRSNNRSSSRNRYQSSRDRGRSSSRDRGKDWKKNIRCWQCDKKGHFKSECRNLN